MNKYHFWSRAEKKVLPGCFKESLERDVERPARRERIRTRQAVLAYLFQMPETGNQLGNPLGCPGPG